MLIPDIFKFFIMVIDTSCNVSFDQRNKNAFLSKGKCCAGSDGYS